MNPTNQPEQTPLPGATEANSAPPSPPSRESITPPVRAMPPVPPRTINALSAPPSSPSSTEATTTPPGTTPESSQSQPAAYYSPPVAPDNTEVPTTPPPPPPDVRPPLSPQPQPAQPPANPSEHPFSPLFQKLRGFFSFAIFIGGIIVAAVVINQFVFQSYYVDGTSMNPTLQNNDRLIIDKVSKTVANVQGKPYIPERGQIVVLDSSILDQNGNNEQLIKRVIGIPGDTIIIKDGLVTIKNPGHPDGFNVDEALGLHLAPTYSSSPITLTVPQNKIFVMGDNRGINGSFDSRAFGPIDGSQTQGRLLLRIFPLNKAGLFK